MKKLLLICATIALSVGLSLRAYFAFVPPPEPTLNNQLSDILPGELNGWKIKDQDMAESPESSERISDFLNFDDALFRIFNKTCSCLLELSTSQTLKWNLEHKQF